MLAYDTLLGKAVRLPLRLIPKGTVLPVMSGALLGARWVVGSGTHGAWLGTYERDKQRAFARTLKPGAVVYDIGAHVGFYTLLSSRLVGSTGRVIAFEPVPRNIAFLRRHLELNKAGSVTLIEAAVADQPGTARFDTGPESSMGALASGGSLEVRVVQIDELVAREGLPSPVVVKMDIEGGEDLALRGMRATLISAKPTIFLATHGDALNASCFAFLGSLGYSIAALDGKPLATTREIVAR